MTSVAALPPHQLDSQTFVEASAFVKASTVRLKIPQRLLSAEPRVKGEEDWRNFPHQRMIIEANNFLTYQDKIGFHLWQKLVDMKILTWDDNEVYTAAILPVSTDPAVCSKDLAQKIWQFHQALLPFIQKLIAGKDQFDHSELPKEPFTFPPFIRA